MIALLSIIYLIPFFILSLLYSGQFLIIFFGYFLNLIVMLSQNSSSSEQALNYFIIDNYVRAIAAISVIFLTKSFKNLDIKSLRLNKAISVSLKKYAFNKRLILNLIFVQLIFIGYVLFVSPNLSILSINRSTTISLTIPGIRYVYPFFLALSPSLFASSILSIISFKKLRFNSLHYILSLTSLINVFLIGQRGFLLMTLFTLFLTSFIFSIYELLKGKLNISEIRKWLFIFLSFPLIYNLRNLNKLDGNKLFFLKMADLEQLKAWDGAIEVVKNHVINTPPIFNNIFNFLNHQSRINIGIPNSSDIINEFLNLYGYFDNGFGLNITIPMDLYVSFKGSWIWIAALFFYYIFVLYRYIESSEYFLFRKKSLSSYLLITCSFSLIFSGLGGWPIALIFYLQAHFLVFFQKVQKTSN